MGSLGFFIDIRSGNLDSGGIAGAVGGGFKSKLRTSRGPRIGAPRRRGVGARPAHRPDPAQSAIGFALRNGVR